MELSKKCIVIHPKDNVAVALCDLKKGETVCVNGENITLMADVPVRHKFAIRSILQAEPVVKYGCPIGTMKRDAAPGAYVHTDEIKTSLHGIIDYVYQPEPRQEKMQMPQRTFMGYVRDTGEVGTRNEIWIVNTVGCVNTTAKILAKLAMEKYGHLVDGIYAFPHVYGCSQLGEDLLSSQRIMAGMVKHPNAAGVLVLSLGCERNNIPEFKKILGAYDEKRVKFLVAQESGDEIEEGLKLIGELAADASKNRRQPVPVSKLKAGLKCGASDGFSGVSANPLVGAFSDLLTSLGGTAILTEISEMFGAEAIMMNRCASTGVFDKAVRMINDFKQHYIKYGEKIDENPSPGNLAGGISTCEEKSLGCIQKGGTSPVTDVLRYGERASAVGLNILSGPGDDMIAITALMAAGCQVILFTTGNGNPLGAPVPTVKISSNTPLFIKKKNWIDFDAGTLLAGGDMDGLANGLFDYVLQVASGEAQTLNEVNGYRDIAMVKDGATT
ncbi:MAG: UxaA family hydrolase [Christensenellales bacterium]